MSSIVTKIYTEVKNGKTYYRNKSYVVTGGKVGRPKLTEEQKLQKKIQKLQALLASTNQAIPSH